MRWLTKIFDLHTIVTLCLHNFNSFGTKIDFLEWFCGDVEQKEMVHAKRSADSTGLDMPKLKRAKVQPEEDVEMV